MALTKINANVIANNTIAVGNIADNSVDATKIASNSILTRHIDDDQITGDQLADALTVVTSVTVPTIAASSNLTVDAGGTIKLDADGGEVQFLDGGTEIGVVSMGSQNMNIESKVADKDILFKGIDDTSDVTALTLDMSEAGAATFNSTVNGLTLAAGSVATSTSQNFALNTPNSLRINIDSNNSATDQVFVVGHNRTDVGTTSSLLVIQEDGKVGIGTASPEYELEVKASTDASINIRAGTNSGDFAGLYFGDTDYPAEGRITYQNSDNKMRFWSDRQHVMTLDDNARVGIGTASPDSPLEISSADDTRLKITDTGDSSELVFRSDGANTQIYTNTAHDLGIYTTGNAGQLFLKQSNGNVGIGDSNPQHPLKVHLTNGEIAMFGSNGMNAPGQYAGIGLGQVLANNTTYQKVSLVTEGRSSGSYVQDFHILVDTVADANSAVLSDAKLTIDGGYGAVNMPSQPCFSAALPAATATDNVIVFGGEHLDIGNHYNTLNGRFTAPIAGNYFFSFWILMDPSGANHYSRVLFRVNGSSSTQWTDNLENASREAQGNYHSVGGAAIIPLGASDYVDLYNSGQNPTYGTQYGNFSGFLVS